MAQPLGQAPEDLFALDNWVRSGGRMLLLADPLLEWPSERPLGDPLRPPPTFVDTGLLGHWGLRLDAADQRGPRRLQLGGQGRVAGMQPPIEVGAVAVGPGPYSADHAGEGFVCHAQRVTDADANGTCAV